ncbi:MAG: hypothetical protein PHV17_07900 [Candidatus Omnitrophica bacterium]|nr:hypothetical protein [Candidatus Omnitrophota bacterium]
MALFKSFLRFKDRLTKFNDQEPLNKLALTVIVLLDIFVLSVVFGGLATHTSQLTSPDEYFPYSCKRVFVNSQWSEANKIDQLQQFILYDYNNYSYQHQKVFDESKISKMHPVCKKFYQSAEKIYKNKKLQELFVVRQELLKKKTQWTKEFNADKNVYDSSLLEKIAGESRGDLTNVSSAMKNRSQEIVDISLELAGIDKKIKTDPLVIKLLAIVNIGDSKFRESLIKDINRYDRIYLFRELVWQLLFLLPLFLVFYFWHTKSIKKNNTVGTLISSHLIVIAAIPILIEIIRVVLDLIPYHFFKELFKLLELFHIMALWHYIVIFLSIGVAISFVYLIQKKLFNKKRLYQKRLMKGDCFSCGKMLPKNGNICPFCGANQFKKCSQCNGDTFVAGEYCVHCGNHSVS